LIARDAASITAGDVLRAVEGPIALVHCVDPGGPLSCERADGCVTHLVWRRLSAVMAEYLDSVTLEALRDEALELATVAGAPAGVCPAAAHDAA
jgi:DNA-binding IscR family transcriptional regulator